MELPSVVATNLVPSADDAIEVKPGFNEDEAAQSNPELVEV